MEFIPPLQFSLIDDGLYRGGYPTLRNFSFLQRLNLKLVISLTPEPPSLDLKAFCRQLDVPIVHFQINRLTPLNHPSLQKKLVQAINLVLEQTSPSNENNANPKKSIYIHCLDGRRITGLMVLLLRRLENYCVDFAYSEFWNFQLPIVMPYHEELRLNRDFDRFVNDIAEEFLLPSEGIPKFLWDGELGRSYPPGLKVSQRGQKKGNVEKGVAGQGDVSAAQETGNNKQSSGVRESSSAARSTNQPQSDGDVDEKNKKNASLLRALDLAGR